MPELPDVTVYIEALSARVCYPSVKVVADREDRVQGEEPGRYLCEQHRPGGSKQVVV